MRRSPQRRGRKKGSRGKGGEARNNEPARPNWRRRRVVWENWLLGGQTPQRTSEMGRVPARRRDTLDGRSNFGRRSHRDEQQ